MFSLLLHEEKEGRGESTERRGKTGKKNECCDEKKGMKHNQRTERRVKGGLVGVCSGLLEPVNSPL